MAELADAADLKSAEGSLLWVQVPPALLRKKCRTHCAAFFVPVPEGVYFLPRILYIPVPQTEHLPLMALRPFFMVTSTLSLISLFALHFMQ